MTPFFFESPPPHTPTWEWDRRLVCGHTQHGVPARHSFKKKKAGFEGRGDVCKQLSLIRSLPDPNPPRPSCSHSLFPLSLSLSSLSPARPRGLTG